MINPSPPTLASLAQTSRREARAPRVPRLLTMATWLVAVPDVARACPDCDVGQIARYRFWTDGFAMNLAAMLVPFLVIVAATAYAERRPR